MPSTCRYGSQHRKWGDVHLWHIMKQLTNISHSVSRPAVGIKAGTHELAVQQATTDLTAPRFVLYLSFYTINKHILPFEYVQPIVRCDASVYSVTISVYFFFVSWFTLISPLSVTDSSWEATKSACCGCLKTSLGRNNNVVHWVLCRLLSSFYS